MLELYWRFDFVSYLYILPKSETSFLQYFEQDDPDLYLSKVKYILDHDVEEMELYFVEEEYDKFGQLMKVSQWLDQTTHLT
jgi:hypothetical protein